MDIKIETSIYPAIVRMGEVMGRICGLDDITKESVAANRELKQKLGNIIFSTIRCCDELGYDPEECINKAIECQKEFKK